MNDTCKKIRTVYNKIRDKCRNKGQNNSYNIQKYRRIILIIICTIITITISCIIYNTNVKEGYVDVGYGESMQEREYEKFKRVYGDKAKDCAFEMVVTEGMLSSKGIGVTEDEINRAVEKISNNNKLSGKLKSEAYIQCKINILSNKAIEYYIKDIKVDESEVTEVVKKQNKYSLVSGKSKVVVESDANTINNENIAFNEIEKYVSIINSSEVENISIERVSDVKVGDVVTLRCDGGTIEYILVNKITNDTEGIRERVRVDIANNKAKAEFKKDINKSKESVKVKYNNKVGVSE